MTIRDLMEQGIYLQGHIRVNKWDDKRSFPRIMADCPNNTIGENIPESAKDLEITHMYSINDILYIDVTKE